MDPSRRDGSNVSLGIHTANLSPTANASQPALALALPTRYPVKQAQSMNNQLQEPIRRRVGGSLSQLPPLVRLAMLQRNALLLRGGTWQPPSNDGTLVRKTVGAPR